MRLAQKTTPLGTFELIDVFGRSTETLLGDAVKAELHWTVGAETVCLGKYTCYTQADKSFDGIA